MKKILKIYDKIEERALVYSLVATVLIIFFQVIMRKVFNNSLSWSEELARFIFIWQIWMGISLGARKKEHIVVELIYGFPFMRGLPGKATRLLVRLINIAFCLFMVVVGWQLTQNLLLKNTLSPALEIPLWIVYGSLPFSFLVTLIRYVVELFDEITGRSEGAPESGEG